MPESTKRPLVNLKGLAAHLTTTERHARHLWQTRQIPGIKLGHLIRFTLDDIDRYVESRRVEAVGS